MGKSQGQVAQSISSEHRLADFVSNCPTGTGPYSRGDALLLWKVEIVSKWSLLESKVIKRGQLIAIKSRFSSKLQKKLNFQWSNMWTRLSEKELTWTARTDLTDTGKWRLPLAHVCSNTKEPYSKLFGNPTRKLVSAMHCHTVLLVNKWQTNYFYDVRVRDALWKIQRILLY